VDNDRNGNGEKCKKKSRIKKLYHTIINVRCGHKDIKQKGMR
jgi:hypothetical protein